MGKRKKHDVPEPEPVEDSDDGSTETTETELLGEDDPTENDDADFPDANLAFDR